MDVPTRSSYVMAIVDAGGAPGGGQHHRGAAQPRGGGQPVPRRLRCSALSTFGWPLLIAGAIKIVYDLLLLAGFRHVRPPEEDDDDRRSRR